MAALRLRRFASSVPSVPSSGAVANAQNRIETVIKYGPGGRSSVSGLVSTVFGSTGFLGRYVVNRLGKIGSQVLLPYRGDEHDWRHLKLMGDLGQINATFYSPKNPSDVAKMVETANIVFNFIGRDYETSNFSYKDVHVKIPESIAKASKQAGVTRLIHVSALGVAEDSPSDFLKSKWEGEQAVKAAFPDVTIVRPASMFGHEDRFLNKLAYLHFVPAIYGDPLVNEGKTEYQPVHVSDVAEVLVHHIVKNGETAGKTYELVGPKTYSYNDLLEMFSEVAKRPINPVSYPQFVLKPIVSALGKLPPSPKISTDDLVRMGIDEVKTGAPGFEAFNYAPAALEQHQLDLLRQYRSAAYYDEPADSHVLKEE